MSKNVKKRKSLSEKFKDLGPAAIVTSAFVGPGTITTTTLAGINYQYEHLWAILFSGLSLMILMEMSGRIGIISDHDIAEAAISSFNDNKIAALIIKGLIVITLFATAFGFEAGNLIGGSLGLADALNSSQWLAALILGGAAFYAVAVGTAKTLEKLMTFFVGLMGIVFILTMILVKPNYSDVASGFIPSSIPEGSSVTIIAMIGTTLIGINLLMQAVTNARKWSGPEHLSDAKFDIGFNVGLGTLITLSIVITSGAVLFGTGVTVTSPIIFSAMLEPTLGVYAKMIGNIGIAAAGLSSAIATPLVLKVVLARLFKWDPNDMKARIAGGASVIFGTAFAAFGTSPTQIIVFASAFSGLFLPIVAILIMIAANNKKLLGEYKNTLLQNILGGFATLVTLGLGLNSLLKFFDNLSNL
ncbi:NRAMP family divalent metal transporter [Alkalibacterium gilvum]|uniref:NRAMP (Natural resistance-associated macrophage protein) metal ion transporters n=1 Tax=Alkalibacterium gilvum TaxID=1130080 RepID=A0A1H6U8H3_9LACT|nr:divalent metal cation transporter [Alkalibacterium gilvum]SEI84590.1 NRAMP (natural resistance-associated macrophage protein) metal ion transporters [Alkalibacterium gilvum]